MNNNSFSSQPGTPRIAFADFWPGFDKNNNIFADVLTSRLVAEVVDNPAEADVLIHSVSGETYRSFPGTRIFYTRESVKPRWDECDYALSFLREEPVHPERHLRLPYWVLEDYIRKTGRIEQFSTNPADVLERHRKFCNFVYSNRDAKERVHFLRTLSRYRHVDSAGQFLNNTGPVIRDKVAFCSGYKFTIAFENYPARGYVTEKLTDAFAAGSLPIYWGDPDVALDFNPKRFVHARDFQNFEKLTEYIRYLDQDDEAYLEYFKEPLFLKNQKSVDDYKDDLDLFFRRALASGPVSNKREDEGVSSGVSQHYNRDDMPRYEDGKPWLKEAGEPCVPTDSCGSTPLRIAVCLFSYKRIEDFLRQVFCMLHQSYPHVHVFAALKGITQSVADELVFPYIQPLIDEGKVTLRLFPNKDQVSNFLDTVRDLDISEYDLFARIDDDDFYDRDYLQHVADFHATLPPGYSSCHWAEGYELHKDDGLPFLRRAAILCTGAAQVPSRCVIEKLREMEDNPNELREVMDDCRRQTGFGNVRFAEDQLLKTLMLAYGCGNIAPWLAQHNISRHLVVQKSNSSVTRGGTVSSDLWRIPMSFPVKREESEHLLDLIHPHRQGSIRLLGKRARRLDGSGNEAEVVFFSRALLVLKWDEGEKQSFVYHSPDVYYFVAEKEAALLRESAGEKEGDSVPGEVLTFHHSRWSDMIRLAGGRGQRSSCGDGARIVERDERRIVLAWDHWDREEFALRNDGCYHLSPYSFSEPDSQEAEEWVIDVLDCPDRLWFHSVGRPTIHLRYLEWDSLRLMERMRDDVLASLSRKPFIRRILVMGLCKNSQAALHLALEIKKHFPQIETGVLECPWMDDLRSPQTHVFHAERETVHGNGKLQVSAFLHQSPEALRRMSDLIFEDMRQLVPNGECRRYRVQKDGKIEE